MQTWAIGHPRPAGIGGGSSAIHGITIGIESVSADLESKNSLDRESQKESQQIHTLLNMRWMPPVDLAQCETRHEF
jgi:hypothetical protein